MVVWYKLMYADFTSASMMEFLAAVLSGIFEKASSCFAMMSRSAIWPRSEGCISLSCVSELSAALVMPGENCPSVVLGVPAWMMIESLSIVGQSLFSLLISFLSVSMSGCDSG